MAGTGGPESLGAGRRGGHGSHVGFREDRKGLKEYGKSKLE